MTTWNLRYDVRPWTVNSERSSGNRGLRSKTGARSEMFARAALVKEWRNAFSALAKDQGIPDLGTAYIDVYQWTRDRRMPDPGACYPAVKAAIDGLVDAGVLAGDDGRYVRRLAFYPPEVDPNKIDGLEIVVTRATN